jgi:malate dehydrogenase (oxaloacetate-decarboxylating)(NADP+)
MHITREEALEFSRMNGKPGRLSICPTKPLFDQRDLSLIYSPGVAYPVLEIARDPELAYEYTSKGNFVAVISNGTAILGLGDRGSLASKPVMEGKAALFKRFADVDGIDIEIDSHDPEDIIRTVALIGATFGGINLEDIKAPECFMIEQRLQKMLDIPVFHDDQHGTAIIMAAAFINALEVTQRKLKDIKVVFSGAGASAIACANHIVNLGLPRQNIWMCDTAGLIHHGRRERMTPEKEAFCQGDRPADLATALKGADVFIGLSAANIMTPSMLRSMRSKPVVLALANPDPEINYELAIETCPDAIIATGRSDYPNQVNNVLGFPFIFRGALDVRARTINEEMKVAATRALVELTRQSVPADVLKPYNLDHLEFGPNYIVPKAFDARVCLVEAPAVAKAAMETGVARHLIDLAQYPDQLRKRLNISH